VNKSYSVFLQKKRKKEKEKRKKKKEKRKKKERNLKGLVFRLACQFVGKKSRSPPIMGGGLLNPKL
jgi:hypothetical protein